MSQNHASLVLSLAEHQKPALALAQHLKADVAQIDVHQFPDGESLIRLPPRMPRYVNIFCSLDHPNEKLINLLFAAKAARKSGAELITLVAPYLCYMRQDKAFHPGEAVSQQIIGEFIASFCDALVTVDSHLHRTPKLSEAIPVQFATNLSAARLISEFLGKHIHRPLLLGPDEESRQWVSKVAEPSKLAYQVAQKTRGGDRDVMIELPKFDFRGHNVVIVDDVASTGVTLATAAKTLKKVGVNKVHAFVTHALFAEGACEAIHNAGVDRIWSTDTISHRTNAVTISPLLAEAVEKLRFNLEGEAVKPS